MSVAFSAFMLVWSGRPRPLPLKLLFSSFQPTANDNLPAESLVRAARDSVVNIPASPEDSLPSAAHGQTTPLATPAPIVPAPGSSCARTPAFGKLVWPTLAV